MTYNNPHPLANPFNTRQFGNVHIGKAMRGDYFKGASASQAKSLEVPNQDVPYMSDMPYNAGRSELTTPNQDIPLGDQMGGGSGCGFLGNSSFFKLYDGTVLDFKTGRVVRQPQHQDEWGNMTIGPEDAGMLHQAEHHQDISLEELVSNVDKYTGTATPSGELNILEPLDPKSAAYWLKAEEEAEKLKTEMTDGQKSLIAAFEKHFPKSKFIDEAKKAEAGKLLVE